MSSQAALGGTPPLPLALRTYRAAMSLARPALWLLLRRRAERGKEDGMRRSERYGIAGIPRPDGDLLWLHAASVGETNAVLPLIERLLAARANLTVLLTTGTVTSAGLAAKRLPARALHQYLPLDSAPYMRRFLDHWRPTVAVLTEQEIWPNLILEAHARGIRLALINARMSVRSLARWQGKPNVAKALFGRLDAVLAQNDQLARALASLGALNAAAVGNLKLDAPLLPIDEAAATALSAALAGRQRFVAASTHAGEDAVVAKAHRLIRSDFPDLCTIIAPRHPHRGPQIAAELAAAGHTVAVRSRGELPNAGTDIYIADTIGELGTLYSVARIAFIGGSLIDRGGQNPIEAVRLGASVLVGPHRSSFSDIYEPLLTAGSAIEVRSAEDVARQITAWLQDPTSRDAIAATASLTLEQLSGGLERTTQAIIAMLTQRPQSP
ncbi:MAG TPA: 3-deoxy-D-manno-octulosonic acid transferase [Hyphomicrobiaceae bacterium]|nr:3-deoxy-D-manno-octulosonic acid transferase [Hyphomicrobiaceae bacterium]